MDSRPTVYDRENRVVGLPLSLPELLTGAENMPASEWCNFTMKAPFQFSIALTNKKLKGSILQSLLARPGLNEPVIRPGWRGDWDAGKFYAKVNSQLSNVEALVMYCTGKVITDPEHMCTMCSAGKGPFSFCVTAEGIEECASCHWDGQAARCSFNSNPLPRKSRRNSKVYTAEEFQALEQDIEEIRVLEENARATQIKLRKLLEEHLHNSLKADDINPQYEDRELGGDSMATLMAQYHNELAVKWLRLDRKNALESIEVSDQAAEEVFEVITRLKKIISNL
ncbi:hypothetical protein N7466_003220 [Penicillium verhagenii]|uniref:uncharacterized protein n=1 Tax=Penicillium verhagenii TaxID=1562060 RepID=UPI002545644D|nr:uncharacterized protein N7466_003220 [Penicillium verhagenii]KAJ5936770.1 hypothetical protein N7466_003220 [Penicillium verhagenii]